MKLIRKTGTSFFLPENALNNEKYFVFADSIFTDADFVIEKCLAEYQFNFLLVFYKGEIDFTTVPLLRNMLTFKSIVWLHSFAESDIIKAPVIQFNNANSIVSLAGIAFGNSGDEYRIFVDKNGSAARISFDNERQSFLVKNEAGDLLFFANRNSSLLNEIEISLRHSGESVTNFSSSVEHSFGSMRFQTKKFKNKAIQPGSPFISSKDFFDGAGEQPILLEATYFEEESYAQNMDLLITLFPFKDFQNASDTKSFMEFVSKGAKKISWDGVNQMGQQFIVDDFSRFRSKLALVEFDDTPRYLFIPDEAKGELTLKGNTPNGNATMLMGFSGTEAVSAVGQNIEIAFRESNELKVNALKDDLGSSLSSITSFITFPESAAYHIDAEKSPLFDNRPAASFDLTTGKIETDYRHITIKTLAPDKSVPYIPTLNFKRNPDLLELERVLCKKRLKNNGPADQAFAEDDTPYITPQGFRKIKNSFEFIKTTSEGEDRFNVENIDADFNISISKEDVFFVTTPRLLKTANHGIKFDAIFALSNFKLDAIFDPLATGDTSHEEKIVIFKYSKLAFTELLADTTKWSNTGSYAVEQTEMQEAIHDSIDHFPNNDDYAYFNRTILADPNWNGVVILNVPISDRKDLPAVFQGLTASQNLAKPAELNDKLTLKTKLKFQFMAFPINKTAINEGSITIVSTSFFGLIDYDLFAKTQAGNDADAVTTFFLTDRKLKFILSKLLVRFDNSQISSFSSFAFVLIPELFENIVAGFASKLTHQVPATTENEGKFIDNIIRLKGNYQKNNAGDDEFIFELESDVNIVFGEGNVLERINLTRAAFGFTKGSTNEYRFDFDASAFFTSSFGTLSNLVDFDALDFRNIGLKFKLTNLFPKLDFDVSNLLVFPKIAANGEGFLSSFPIKFNRFRFYNILRNFEIPDFDFMDIFRQNGNETEEGIAGKSLWSMIFDFDLGTLGDLSFLKNLKGELLLGWFKKGGFRLGLNIQGPSTKSVHLDLFGALKLDVDELGIGRFKPQGSDNCSAYFLRLKNARLTVLGTPIPSSANNLNGIIISDFSSRKSKGIAWLINLDDNEENKLLLGLGQRVGPPNTSSSTSEAIENSRSTFKKNLTEINPCSEDNFPDEINFRPDRNWLVASEDTLALISKEWSQIITLKFIFNDPALYGLYVRLNDDNTGSFEGFAIDVLYKKISENIGVWSTDIQLPDSIRNQEFGGGAITFPNLGLEIYTNGDWKIDLGYPRSSNDWSRSCLVQIRPFVGWGGFYLSRIRTTSLSLFGPYEQQFPDELSNCNIIQAGFAFRIGIGAYVNKGIFFAGASLSVYGILEGAFAFKQGQTGIAKFLPDHFALRGRVGAIAEVIGYVDFKIIKASVYIVLSVEFGMLLVMIKGRGLQPVPLYIEGNVSVSVRVKVACFRIFRKRICIYISLSFRANVRFQYTLGERNTNAFAALAPLEGPLVINVPITKLPVVYTPAITLAKDDVATAAAPQLRFIHNFSLPFFGVKRENGTTVYSGDNIIKNDVLLPLFTAMIDGLRLHGISANYENLRSVLLKGEIADGNNIVSVPLKFDDYRPYFILGEDLNTNRDLLRDVFHLSNAEADEFIAINTDKCRDDDRENCPFVMIPVPISSKIVVRSPDINGGMDTAFLNGFHIAVENIAVNAADSSDLITLKVLPDKTSSSADIELLESYFDSFKTQFLDRKKVNAFEEETFDLRESFVIPEFFKLAALLTLETYASAHTETADKHRLYDPANEITAAMLVEDSRIGWKLNSHLTGLAGQLNYFFNHGLRLPDRNNGGETAAWFELLKQASPVSAESNRPLETARISIIKADDDTVSATMLADIFGIDDTEAEVAAFKKSIAVARGQDLSLLTKDISIKAKTPYRLVDVRLALPNARLTLDDGSARFFELPRKLAREAARTGFSNTYSCDLLVGNNENDTTESLAAGALVNIEIKVKAHKQGNKVQVLEIANVYIDDLDLMNRVKTDPSFIKSISLFAKKGKDENLQLTNVIHSNAHIVKTNLSTRTYPPVIINQNNFNAVEADDKYVANLNDTAGFTRLIWEGLTTNNGGYFIVLDKDVSSVFTDTKNQETLVLSFQSADVSCPGFCNYIGIRNEGSVFSGLDQGTHHLFLNNIRESGTAIKEYHPAIPSHCFGFSISRSTLPDELSQYLPIEFFVESDSAQPKPDSLPIMPLGNDSLQYNHIIPTIAVSSVENAQRYDHIGHDTTLHFGIRDIYGFRAIDIPGSFVHSHKYFDKIIPLSAWPFTSFALDYRGFDAANGKTKWIINATLESRNSGELLQSDEERSRILETLYTAAAQVNDVKMSICISHQEAEVDKKILNSILLQAIRIARGEAPEFNTKSVAEFIVEPDSLSPLKTAIDTSILFKRESKHCIEVEENAWEKETISMVSNDIYLKKSVDELNNALQNDSPYTLGISSDENRKRIHYIINTDLIREINSPAADPLSTAHYFGIKPYSNTLWSGEYLYGNESYRFSEIDLDVSLRSILSQVDKLTAPANLAEAVNDNAAFLPSLLRSKKALINEELSNKTDNVDQRNAGGQTALRKEFRDLLLDKLDHFYRYDGLIKLDIDSPAALQGHRLTVNVKSQEHYNLVSSKIDFRNPAPEWIILFDRQEDSNINLRLQGQVTHLEYDIKTANSATVSDSPEIESSSWIQLVTPIDLKREFQIINWPGITREFPTKPVITKHNAVQAIADGSTAASSWNIKLGDWNYELAVKDDYVTNDILEITLKTRALITQSAMQQSRNFKGFIAYWSSKIANRSQPFPSEDFIRDLDFQLSLPEAIDAADSFEEEKKATLLLQKMGTANWKIIIPPNSSLEAGNVSQNMPGSPDIIISGFSVLRNDQALATLSLLPEIRVFRNAVVRNEAFRYVTASISPVSWATPYIHYWKPIQCNETLQSVYNALPTNNLPYKSTAKYIIDMGPGLTSPVIPVRQMEYDKQKPADIDALFNGYENGSPAVSITVYNNEEGANLPVFFADSIVKI